MRKIFTRNRDEDDEFEYENTSKFYLPKKAIRSIQIAGLGNGEMHLIGSVDEEMARFVREGLLYIRLNDFNTSSDGSYPEVKAYITSLGGDELSGFEIRDLFAEYSQHGYTEALVRGYACSAASMMVLQGFKWRKAMENATIMCHNGSFSIPYIDQKEFRTKNWPERIARSLKRGEKRALEILCDRTGKTEEEVQLLLDEGELLTAEEAYNFGLIDEVVKIKFANEPEPKKTDRRVRIPRRRGLDEIQEQQAASLS